MKPVNALWIQIILLKTEHIIENVIIISNCLLNLEQFGTVLADILEVMFSGFDNDIAVSDDIFRILVLSRLSECNYCEIHRLIVVMSFPKQLTFWYIDRFVYV